MNIYFGKDKPKKVKILPHIHDQESLLSLNQLEAIAEKGLNGQI